MCGRYTLSCPPDELRVEFEVEPAADYTPRYNIAPQQPVPVVGLSADGERRLAVVRWGLVPSWAKSLRDVPNPINARAESLLQRRAFRDSFLNRRCLVLADGFYEWRREAGRKQPYRFHRRDEKPFAFAGLWDRWESPDGETLWSCTIVTTSANGLVQPIHDRMPVILDRSQHAMWLDPATPEERLGAMLEPREFEAFEVYPVSTLVNKATNDSAECMLPVPSGQAATE
jgi:putative SOS response-associated peptidase YedK